ncbi:MAG: L-threonylcarbamoyladenylate synthase [Candidatus Wolfebacteria bacterium]|nr:L-threonylcarbamoyladenylate synthase [Candidatus Wolfebacteria bacterium]
MIVKKRLDKETLKILKSGGVGVLKTDTIYGIVGLALNKGVVRRIYSVKKRNPVKKLIILINSIKDLDIFSVRINSGIKKQLDSLWPGKVSVELPCLSKKFNYLHHGTKLLAFRLPQKKSLVNLLKKTGPLVAPSANPEGKTPAEDIKQAILYFGKKVDFYIDSGKVSGKSSTLVVFKNNRLEVVRQGAVKTKH